MLALAAFAFFTPNPLGFWWKLAIILVVILGLGAIIAQGLIQRREDRIRDARDDDRFRLLERVSEQFLPKQTVAVSIAAVESVTLELTDADPRIYVKVLDQRRTLHPKVVFSVQNRGNSIAHKVQILSLKLNCGEAAFPAVEALAKDEAKEVVPLIENIMPVWRHDITRIMVKEWDNAGDISVFEFSRPMFITYEDYTAKKKWETTFDLVYHVIQDIVERDWELSDKPELIEVRNIKFRRLPS